MNMFANRSPLMRPLKALGLGLSALGLLASLSACAPTLTHQGYLAVEANPAKDIKVGDSLATVQEKLGSPSQVSSFEPNIWYYIDQTTSKMTYKPSSVIAREVTVVEFDKQTQTVASIKSLNLADSREIKINPHTTPTRGRSMTALEQILGTVGRQTPQKTEDPGNQHRRD